jgi:hypothetical protein
MRGYKVGLVVGAKEWSDKEVEGSIPTHNLTLRFIGH